MTTIYLQGMLENLGVAHLPPNWQGFDLQDFSRSKKLWDYQQSAIELALVALWKYYQTPDLSTPERKRHFFNWYRDFGMDQDLDIPLDRKTASKRRIAALLETWYRTDLLSLNPAFEFPAEKIPYEHFINRMSFWMATGSGKTLIIVKMIAILQELMKRREIPERDILILAHRDDLLDQLRLHVDEFNTSGDIHIRLHELRDYSQVKHSTPRLFSASEINVFYYRSDNLSDEQKEKIIDFRSYENDGEWYIMLDEAHKGDKEDSKRQHIYSILSRNGFLFNFSATFTDPRDIICTAFNFNLSEFIRKGFGKHIYIFDQETTAFRKSQDFSESEKQKIVLKALIMLSLIRQVEGKVREVEPMLFHRPLLMTLVNSVNTKEADLKLFFREVVRIAKGAVDESQWQAAKQDLLSELAAMPSYLYETGLRVSIDQGALSALTQSEMLKHVFNTAGPGEIEILIRPSDRKEMALKLKTSEEAFALIRIGDVSEWLTKELSGYEVNQHFNDESFFKRLNESSSDINILLGSRSFYEGWDSNRPNVIMYINIGMGDDAKKFILQSVGRGARIEPFKDMRKRFRDLCAAGLLSEAQEQVFHQVKNEILPLESEFIFGTNRDALKRVVSELDQEDTASGKKQLSLAVNEAQTMGKSLLIPVYKESKTLLHEDRTQAKFTLSQDALDLLTEYQQWLGDDRLMLALHDAQPQQIKALKVALANPSDRFRTDGLVYKNLDVLMTQALRFFSLHGRDFERFKVLEDEINHFRHLRITLEEADFTDLERKLEEFRQKPARISELKAKYEASQITLDQLLDQTNRIGGEATFTHQGQTLYFKNIQNHYYLPLIVSDDEKIDYIRSIIRVRSEVQFINQLENYLNQTENGFNGFDWWLFSRVDENSDNINVPYYDPVTNKIFNFKPDFIFWLQKGADYHIMFVDPKGTGRSEHQHKVDGFRRLFEENDHPIVFRHKSLNVRLHLFLFTEDVAWTSDYYRRYWLDNFQNMLKNL